MGVLGKHSAGCTGTNARQILVEGARHTMKTCPYSCNDEQVMTSVTCK